MTPDKITTLTTFTDTELKEELARRRVCDRARRHLPSAVVALNKAHARVERYRGALREAEHYANLRAQAER